MSVLLRQPCGLPGGLLARIRTPFRDLGLTDTKNDPEAMLGSDEKTYEQDQLAASVDVFNRFVFVARVRFNPLPYHFDVLLRHFPRSIPEGGIRA